MALTPHEIELAESLGFETSVFELLKRATPGHLHSYGRPEAAPAGVSFDVADGEEAERLIGVLQPQLLSLGYRAFWSTRYEENGMHQGSVVAVLHGTDPYAILTVAEPDGGNYGLTTDDIRSRLKAWEATCQFDIVGASRDWVAVVFTRLPDDVCGFAEEVALFCPDSTERGMGSSRPTAEMYDAAGRLCPTLSDRFRDEHRRRHGTPPPNAPPELLAMLPSYDDLLEYTETNVRLLATSLAEKKYLFLWWD